MHYYDHHPIVALDQPLVICGMISVETRSIAYQISALNGLPFADVDRLLEHHFGQSLPEILAREEAHQLRRVEGQILASSVAAHPRGVISVPDRMLSTRGNRRLLERQSFLVALRYSAKDCYERYRRLYPEIAPEWISEAPGPVALESLYLQWMRRFKGAHLEVDMTGRSWKSASKTLAGQLVSDHPSFAAN